MNLAPRRDRLLELTESVCSLHGTPVYVFWEDTLRSNYREFRSVLDEQYPDSEIHFAVKANFNPAVLSVLRDEGCSAEVFASGEIHAAEAAGFDPETLLVTGMNRPIDRIERALQDGITEFLVDNEAELERLVTAAANTGVRPRILIRCNPAMDVPTHPDIATATHETKFGLDIESGRAMAVAERAASESAVELAGIQLHIGSQIDSVVPYEAATQELCSFAIEVRDKLGVTIDILDLGGGFPVAYDEDVPAIEAFVERIASTIEATTSSADFPAPTLYLEPGRRLVGDAGTLVSTVGVVKETPYATFAVLDTGTNAVSSYWPYPIYALSDAEPTESYHVAGPLCYSGDVIAEDVSLPELSPGDRLAIDRIGAYSLGSASHTNATPKPPIVLVRSDGTVETIRRPEEPVDVFRNAVVPHDLQ